jgi:hypothetical protein
MTIIRKQLLLILIIFSVLINVHEGWWLWDDASEENDANVGDIIDKIGDHIDISNTLSHDIIGDVNIQNIEGIIDKGNIYFVFSFCASKKVLNW